MTPKNSLDQIPPIVFIALTLTIFMFGASGAHGASPGVVQGAPEVALMPPVPQMPQTPQTPVTLSASCDGAVAVFSVRNNTARWAARGEVRLMDAATGRVLRTRTLVFGERQTASFRVPGSEMQSGRYRLMVRTTDGLKAYVKSFAGHCRPQEQEAHTARR